MENTQGASPSSKILSESRGVDMDPRLFNQKLVWFEAKTVIHADDAIPILNRHELGVVYRQT